MGLFTEVMNYDNSVKCTEPLLGYMYYVFCAIVLGQYSSQGIVL